MGDKKFYQTHHLFLSIEMFIECCVRFTTHHHLSNPFSTFRAAVLLAITLPHYYGSREEFFLSRHDWDTKQIGKFGVQNKWE